MKDPKIVSRFVLQRMKKKGKIIPETLSVIFMAIFSGWIAILGFFDVLSPLALLGILLAHTIVIAFSRFSEFDPQPIVHFMRPLQGIFLIFPYLVGFTYYFSLLTLGGNNETSLQYAIFTVKVSSLMFIWAVFSAYSVIGIYFAGFTIYRWFPWLIQLSGAFNTPLILYFQSIFVALVGIGSWFTHSYSIYTVLLQKQDFGEKQRLFRRTGWIILMFSIICSILFLMLEPIVWKNTTNIVARNLW